MKAFAYDSINDDHVKSLFTTRMGGVSPDFYGSLNMGCSTGDTKEHVLENCRRVAECFGTTADFMVSGAQTHTKNIKIVTAEDAGKGVTRARDYEDIDGLITNVEGLVLFTGHADCNPVVLYDPVQKVIGAIHSGWMGTLLNITAEAITLMQETYGCKPADIRLAIGPALCRDCFEVDLDVAEKFMAAYSYVRPDGNLMVQKGKKSYIDLKAIIVREAGALGVLPEHMEVSDLCTKENPRLFYSHRYSGTRRGVMASAIMLR